MLKLDGVHKKFKSALVAEKISVDLGPCTYGLLGRNGSGKTTLLRCITRVEKVNGGRIVYTDGDGREVKDYLDHIGYLPQNFDVFPELTAYEVLQFFANLKGYKITEAEIDHLLEILNLSPQRDMTVKTLSGGMKRRLGIAQALIGDPDVLLLDEPTAGLDPEERLNFKNVIRRIKGDRCVVLSTHIITDIESLCDRILVLCDGRITAFDSCGALADVARGKVYAVEDTADLATPFHSMGPVKIISKAPLDAPALEPTVEDGYICFIEKLS